MNIKLFLLIILAIISCANIYPQSSGSFEFLPSGQNFMPLRANHQEAKIGVWYHTATTNLKVDIGNNIDLLAYQIPGSKAAVTAGIEFMAYALSTSYEGNRLQIDALDGFFGGNLSFSKVIDSGKLLARFRIIHNSAHFADGHYDNNAKQWINNLTPVPYTKDFGELTLAHQMDFDPFVFRYYGGFSYATLVRPDNLKRYNYHTGFEFALKDLFGTIAGKDENIFLAAYFTTEGQEKYILNQQTMLGFKFGEWDRKGIVIYTSYYSGGDIFGAYYNRRTSKFGIGFSVDFP